jgi:hypothetical protein
MIIIVNKKMKKIEYLSLFAGFLETIQLYLLGSHIKAGFIFGCVAGCLWVFYAIKTKSAFGLFIICPVAFILNIRGFLLWRN